MLTGNFAIGNNMHLPAISPLKATTTEQLRKRLVKAENKIEKLVELLLSGNKHIEGNGLYGVPMGVLQRVFFAKFEHKVFTKFFADEKCTECGWCVKTCPEDNIELTDKGIVFHDRCIHCLRCYNFCPTEAIQLNEKTKDTDKYKRYKGLRGCRVWLQILYECFNNRYSRK